MRALLPVFLALFLVLGISPSGRGQSNDAPSNPQLEREKKMISFLTPEQQEKYAKARAQALENNPKLKADGDALIAQAGSMTQGSPADRQAFMEKMNSHRQLLRQAMLKEDGTLEPIFAEIDKHISEMKAKHLGQVQGSPNPSNAPNPAP